MLREQHVALRLSLAELLFELGEGGFQRRDLRALIVDLLAEAVGVPLGALVPLDRGTGEIVLSFLDGELRLAQPLDRPVGILLRFFLEHMLVRNRDRDLRLHLQQLVLHVENHLLDHRRRVLRPVDEIVQVCPDQRAHAF